MNKDCSSYNKITGIVLIICTLMLILSFIFKYHVEEAIAAVWVIAFIVKAIDLTKKKSLLDILVVLMIGACAVVGVCKCIGLL